MSRYADAFECLAERGRPQGATTLLERVDESLGSPLVTAIRSEPKRHSALFVAAAAFLAVLAVGGVWALLIPSENMTVSESGIEWIELPPTVGGSRYTVKSGPAGFLRWGTLGIGDGDQGLQYSPDGHSWMGVTPPEAYGGDIRTFAASGELWLIDVQRINNERTLFVSSDGQSWEMVAMPDDLAPYVEQVFGTSDGFAAVRRDPLGSGTDLWWSTDGRTWSEGAAGLPGDYVDATVTGTPAGIVWHTALSEGATRPVFHSTDGAEWIEGAITLPDDVAASATGWLLGPIVVVDNTWFAFGQVFGLEPGSTLLVWTSIDGVDWQYRGQPEFGSLPGQSVSTGAVASVGDHLVLQTAVATGGVFDGSTIRFTEGEGVRALGQVWATTDGTNWDPAIDVGRAIRSLAGSPAGSDQAIVVYSLVPDQQASMSSPVTTTNAAFDESDLDEEGLALQEQILSDGTVTRDELVAALEGWKSCMEGLGIAQVTYEIDPQGQAGMSYGSPSPDVGDAESDYCQQSYLAQINEALGRQ